MALFSFVPCLSDVLLLFDLHKINQIKMQYFQVEQALRDIQYGRRNAVGRYSLVLLVAEPAPESWLWRSQKLLQAVGSAYLNRTIWLPAGSKVKLRA